MDILKQLNDLWPRKSELDADREIMRRAAEEILRLRKRLKESEMEALRPKGDYWGDMLAEDH